jgi:hypothetical protein
VSRVEVRVLLDRDKQRPARHVDLALVPADESAERTSRFSGLRQVVQVPDVGLSVEPEALVLPVGLADPELVDPLEIVPPPYAVEPELPLPYELPLLKPPYVVS